MTDNWNGANDNTENGVNFEGASPKAKTLYPEEPVTRDVEAEEKAAPAEAAQEAPMPPIYRPANPYGSNPGGSSYGSVPPRTTESSSYSSGPMEPPKKKKKKKRVGLRILAAVLALALAFGAGYGGALLAIRNQQNALPQVVIQQNTGTESAPGGTEVPISNAEWVADKVMPSVVAIMTEQMTTDSFWFGSQVQSGAGSGVIMSADGYILTNNHVIDGATTIQVQLSDDSVHDAELVGAYPAGDIAVVKIDAQDLTPATFANMEKVRQGAAVYAVGNPEGTFSGSITNGIISALNRTIKVSDGSGNSNHGFGFGFGFNSQPNYVTLDVIQFSAAVSPGNSGGGLFNTEGELVGVVCAKSSDTDSEGLGFAIPSDKAMEIAQSLITTGTYEGGETESGDSGVTQTSNKAVLGITVVTLTSEQAANYGVTPGLYVASITAESTRKAGLQVQDRIISVDSVIANTSEDLTGYLAEKEPGDTVTLNVEREGQFLSLQIELVENDQNN